MQADRECEALRDHAKTLSASLESHARVLERLIALNAELMDAANAKALQGMPSAYPQL